MSELVTVAQLMERTGKDRAYVDAVIRVFKIETVGKVKLAGRGQPARLYPIDNFNRALLKVVEYERLETAEGTSIDSSI